jgi:hypothetical protein
MQENPLPEQPDKQMVQQIVNIAHLPEAPVDTIHLTPRRLTFNTIVQGVPFHAGFHPHTATLADSPSSL